MATISDVAAKAGVGVGTVSRVLNNSPNIAPATRERVLDAIKALNYLPNQLARRLSNGRTQTIGVVVPFFTNPSAVERLRGVADRLRDSGYDMVLYNVETPLQRDEYFRTLSQPGRVDGLLILSLRPGDREVERFNAVGMPAVLVDAAHEGLPSVTSDDMKGGYLAARYLLDLGHRRVAFVGDLSSNPMGFTSSSLRRQGFRKALQEADLPIAPELFKEGPHGRHIAHGLTAELLKLSERPTAVFAASDTQALGVLEAAQQLGLSVPHDLSIIGFDDIEVTPYVGLTTVRQPLTQSGSLGIDLLLSALKGEAIGPQQVVLPLELVARKTTAPPRRSN